MKTPELAETEKRLEESAINPELAAVSSDLLDYRERLARDSVNDAEKSKSAHSPNASDLFKTALGIWEGLYSDFPKTAKYGEALAACHESMASVEEPYKRNR